MRVSIFKMAKQSQKHGFTLENYVRTNVFNLPEKKNDTNIHDIPKEKNRFNPNENCSIKTTGSDTICCGDILRLHGYNFEEEQNRIIVIRYNQTETHKVVTCIYEIDYNLECHKLLFGDLTREVLEKYVNDVKSIPRNVKGKEAKNLFNYLDEKKRLEKEYNSIIQINPKVDSSQSRVQCSIPKFETTLKDFIIYKSPPETPNIIRGNEIPESIESGRRIRKNKHKNLSQLSIKD